MSVGQALVCELLNGRTSRLSHPDKRWKIRDRFHIRARRFRGAWRAVSRRLRGRLTRRGHLVAQIPASPVCKKRGDRRAECSKLP